MAGTSFVRVILINIVVMIIVAAALFGGYVYYSNSINYVTTDDAQVTGTMIPITVQFGGKLNSWYGAVNSTVNQGDVLGSENAASVLAATPSLVQLTAHNTTTKAKLTNAETVVSPISGTIVQNNASVGQVVQPGQVLAQVVDMNNLSITANVAETDYRHISVGQTVDITIDGIANTTFKGTVESIGVATQSALSIMPNLTASSGSYTKLVQRIPVVISLSGGYTGKTLIPGMSAKVTIHINNNNN